MPSPNGVTSIVSKGIPWQS